MREGLTGAFARLPTPAKILIIMSLALMPIGLASAWSATRGLTQANQSIEGRARDQAMVAAESIVGLLARNTLALRVAANAALSEGPVNACARVQRILAVAPAVAREFALFDEAGGPLCTVGAMDPLQPATRLAPGADSLWVSSAHDALFVRSGVIGGSATVRVTAGELREAIDSKAVPAAAISLSTGGEELVIVPGAIGPGQAFMALPIADGRIEARMAINRPEISTMERLFIFLPLLMWVAAALVSWWMVHRLLIRPLRRLQGVVTAYLPGDDSVLEIPEELGPATEIHELGDAFRRAVERIEGAEHEARAALEGQRRLVREVHHRVKNNLQVVASMLSIHGRSAEGEPAKAAYSSIGRRVDALSVVHRNHFAEMEENRGVALRPLLTELAAGLRAAAPASARTMPIDLDLASPSTTQDVAVAVAFLLTEIVEFAMLRAPSDGVEIMLRRTNELTASLSVSASVLIPETDAADAAKNQFERILDGLARQLRSSLERKVGRYMVTIPVFPDR